MQTFVKESVTLRGSVNSSIVQWLHNLCNKSNCEIFLIINVWQSTVSGMLTKWKRLGMAVTESGSDRPHKMLKPNFPKSRSLQTSKVYLLSLEPLFMRLAQEHWMDGFHGRAGASESYITKRNANCCIQLYKACHYWTLVQWRAILWREKSIFSDW